MKRGKTFDLLFKTTYFLFIYATGVLLTLYMHDAYFDLMETKAACLNFISIVLLPFLLLCAVFKIKEKRFIFDNMFDRSLLVFVIVCVVSTLFSRNPLHAWNGTDGWYIGLSAILFLVSVFFVLKDEYFKETYVYYPLIGVVVFEFVMTVLACAKIDLFSLKEFISGNEYYSYFGTIGNSNWCVGYYSLIVPLLFILYLQQKDRIKQLILLFISVLGFVSSLLNGADGVLVGYAFFVLITIPYLFNNLENIKNTSLMMMLLAVVMSVVRSLPFFRRRFEVIGGICRIVFNYPFIAVLLVLSLVLYVFSIRCSNDYYERIRNNLIRIIYIMLIVSVVGLCIYVFTRFDSKLGSERVDLWKLSIDVYFNDFSLKEKIIGIGPELLKDVYSPMGSDLDGRVYVSSHSELIQLLLTTGIAGLMAWQSCWVSLFISYIKSLKNRNIASVSMYAGLSAYFGQSLINSATTLNVCILCFVVILLRQFIDSNRLKESDKTKKKKYKNS